jgi:hypothetical protein
MISKYKTHITEMSNLRKVLDKEVKKLRKDYSSTTNKYELDRLGYAGRKKKERLERIVEHLEECNGLLAKWDTVTNDQLRELIHNGKSI